MTGQRATVRAMKRDTAERLAATTVEGVTVEQAQTIIRAFLAELVRCPVCDGTARFMFSRDTAVEKPETGTWPFRADGAAVIPAGTTGSCPRCGAHGTPSGGKGDPDYIAWHCIRPDNGYNQCGPVGEHPNGHEECGWRVLLPWPS